MNLAKLDRDGQVSIPQEVLKRIGVEGEQLLSIDLTPDGAIVLRPTEVNPIEIYSDERVQEFLAEDSISAEKRERAVARRVER